MKKFICILMIVCCVGCLCSCANSQNNYAKLEERISRLEKLFGEPNKPTTIPTDNPTITDFVEPLPSNSTEPLTTSSVDSYVYDLSQMTPENIVETIKYYIDSRPQNGDTYESVKSRLQVEPLDWKESSGSVSATFVNNIYRDYPHDCIKFIAYSNFDLGMNGVTLENCKTILFETDFNIEEYSRAEKIFDAIVNYLNSNTNNSVTIQKNGGRWSFYTPSINKSNLIIYVSGEMNRVENSYSFHIILKINDTNQE